MEFRQVVHTVCRSAAAATRPSLASTRPSPSAIVSQHHYFTTNNKQQSEAAAAVAPQPQSPPPPPPLRTANPTTSPQYRIDQLRASLQKTSLQNQSASATPPRPPPIRSANTFDDKTKRRSLFGRSTTLTGRAPGTASSAEGLFNLPTQISADMDQATGSSTMTDWNEDEFLGKHYDVHEPELRLRPSTGRTIHVKGNVDLARGLRLLGRAIGQNKIRNAVYLARQHERPALKRKRMKRERWQARFLNGFRSTIHRVMELKSQGW